MKYVKSFDGLRAISILFVLLTHLGVYQMFKVGSYGMDHVFPLFSGEAGVTIFFALSGFLITRILLNELKNTGKIDLKRFYIRRALRLLPALLIFYAFIAVLMKLRLMDASRLSFLYSFFYLYNFVPISLYFGELGHTWSLAVEEQFYLTWPFILALFNSKKAFYWGVLLLMLCVAARLILPILVIPIHGRMEPIANYYRVQRFFIPAVAPIMIGSMISLLIDRYRGARQRILDNYAPIAALAGLFFLAPLYLSGTLLTVSSLFQAAGVSLFLALLLYRQDGVFARLLATGPLVYIGKISYSIYVFQGLFLRTGPGGHMLINSFPLNIILTLICAILSFHFVEKPILRYKERFTPKSQMLATVAQNSRHA